jgi:enterochelin esterase-like enzyme
MRKWYSVIFLFILIGAFPVLASEKGKVVENLVMKSEILPYDVSYCVYFPPGYEESTRRFPVVYLLHGYSDREWAWVQFGEIQEAVDQAVSSRKIPPMIIVMPDGKVSFYVNDYRRKEKYEDMFIQELIPHIDAAYRTRPQQEYRGIAGLSMGGYGALTLSMRHMDLFSGCAAFSAAIWTDESISDPQGYDRFFKEIFGPLKEGNLPEHFRKYNPLDIVRITEPDVLTKVRYYIDCGDDDFLIAGNCALHLLMTEKEIPHEFRVRDGGHSWIYWRTGIIDGLQFIAQRFHR